MEIPHLHVAGKNLDQDKCHWQMKIHFMKMKKRNSGKRKAPYCTPIIQRKRLLA